MTIDLKAPESLSYWYSKILSILKDMFTRYLEATLDAIAELSLTQFLLYVLVKPKYVDARHD